MLEKKPRHKKMNILKKIINYKKSKIITDKKNVLLFSNQNKKSLFKSKIVNNLKNNIKELKATDESDKKRYKKSLAKIRILQSRLDRGVSESPSLLAFYGFVFHYSSFHDRCYPKTHFQHRCF